jgi:hypothetical protein
MIQEWCKWNNCPQNWKLVQIEIDIHENSYQWYNNGANGNNCLQNCKLVQIEIDLHENSY